MTRKKDSRDKIVLLTNFYLLDVVFSEIIIIYPATFIVKQALCFNGW